MNLKNPLILFDGECILCDSFINFAIKRDKKKKFKLAYLQSEIAAQLGREFNFEAPEHLDAVILIKNNKVHTKSSAILRMGVRWIMMANPAAREARRQ